MNEIKILNQLIDITKVEVENLKAENRRLQNEVERLLCIIENLSSHERI